MSDKRIKFDYRKYRGEKEWMTSAYRKYDFPVTTRRIGEPAPQSGR
ncbi:hypothetical protein GTY75_05010 [Streptomyces sp. SID8381]|nr:MULTISPECIES: hypothetical protein [unclassified Streptomyces]MYX26034.1 hypothetical protein [Streptomyces sp. SID8381]